MQFAGVNCQLCECPVRSELEASACSHCHAVFHKACLESVEQICAQCGKHCSGDTAPDAPANPAIDPATQFAEGGFQRSKTSARYAFSLMLVAFGMVLLPVIYLGLIMLFAFSVAAYALNLRSVLAASDYGVAGLFAIFLVYFTPLIAGTALTFCLVKPLFAPRPPRGETFVLNHADAPGFFALIGWICRSLHAPMPSRVDIDCSVNASAAFRGGFRSIFGNDISLCVGLPLVAGLNLSQFAGVIAHEYGHFSQSAALRARYLINCINLWFYRAVYERDTWDLALARGSEEENQAGWIVLALYVARAGVAFGRGILWGLMILGNLLSSFMSRQMEFDADRYEMKLCGSDTFISRVLRLQQLSLGWELGQKQLIAKWKKEKKLFDQIPDFIVSRADEISAQSQEQHYARVLKRKTRFTDSHPSDAERIARARAAREPGVFHDTAPAARLFANYAELSRRLTLFFYRDLAGSEPAPELLIATEPAAGRADHDCAADRETIRRCLLGIATESRPLILRENKSLVFRREEILRAEIQASRERMEQSLPVVKEAFAEFTQAESRRSLARQAAQLLEAGFQFDPAEFGLADSDAELAQAGIEQQLQAADAILQPFEEAGRCRLADTIQLLRLPQIAARIPQAAKLQDEAREMIWVLERLGEILGPLLELREDCGVLEVLLRYRRSQPAADNATAALENLATGIQERVNAIQEQARQIRYPFPHATEQVLVSDYARNKEYHADPFELALREGRSHTEKLFNLYTRVLARLVTIGEQVGRELET